MENEKSLFEMTQKEYEKMLQEKELVLEQYEYNKIKKPVILMNSETKTNH
jgi:hypothetical protein